jgi:hypothetical protein
MSAFVSKPSAAYCETVAQIKALIEAEGVDNASRACAEAMRDALKACYAARVKAKPRETPHTCIRRLQGKRSCGGGNLHAMVDRPPRTDHATEWHQAGKTVSIVSHPYGISLKDMRDIVSYCDQHGFDAQIDASSWYFLGHTVRLEWRKHRESA